MDKVFATTGLEGQDISITYKSVISAYDADQISEVFSSNMTYNSETKQAIFKDGVDYVGLSRMREEAIVRYLIKSWTVSESFTLDEIKKALPAKAYAQLVRELEAVVSEGDLDDAKKNNSPEN